MASSRRTASNEQISTFGDGKTYNDFQTFETAKDGDKVTQAQSDILEGYDKSPHGHYDTDVVFQTSTCSGTLSTGTPTYTLGIRAANNEGHTGKWNTGFGVDSSSNAHVINIGDDWIFIQDLEITQNINTPQNKWQIYTANQGAAIVGCLIMDMENIGSGRCYGGQSDGAVRTFWVNNCFKDISDIDWQAVWRVANGGTTAGDGPIFYNNTIYAYDGSSGVRSVYGNSDWAIFKNVYVASFSPDEQYNYGSYFDSNSVTCGGNQAEGAGSHKLAGTGHSYNLSPSFVDAANNDFHLQSSDTALKDAGTDLSADSYFAFDDDVDGDTRSGTWDRGFDEVPGNFTASDAFSIGVSESESVQASLAVADSVTVGLVDDSQLLSTLSVSDSFASGLDETSQLLLMWLTTDTLPIGVGELMQQLVGVSRQDALPVGVVELFALLRGMNVQDALPVLVDDAARLASVLAASDVASVQALDALSQLIVSTTPSDAVPVGLLEAVNALSVSTSASDSVTVATSEAIATLLTLFAAESLSLSVDEVTTIALVVRSADQFGLSLDEAIRAINVSAMAQESLGLTLAETILLVRGMLAVDVVQVGALDASAIVSALQTSDNVSTALQEVSATTAMLVRQDALPFALQDAARTVSVTLVVADSFSISLQDATPLAAVLLSTAESLGLGLDEVIAIVRTFVSSESFSVGVTESASIESIALYDVLGGFSVGYERGRVQDRHTTKSRRPLTW